MSNILITGGCGFVGSSLALELDARGHTVTVLDNLSRHGSSILQGRLQARGIAFVRGDVRNPADLSALTDEFSLLIDCSAETSVLAGTATAGSAGSRYLLDVNLSGAVNCFEWASERRVPVIFLSSSRVYPYDRLNAMRYREEPTRFVLDQAMPGVTGRGVSVDMPLAGVRSLYGASKLSAEFLLQEYAVQFDLPVIINRCGVIAGPWQLGKADQGIFAFWMAQHHFRRPLSYIGFGGHGKQVRDLIHVRDLSDLIVRQIEDLLIDAGRYRGKIYNVGGGPECSLSLCETTELCRLITGNRLEIGRAKTDRPADLIWYLTDDEPVRKAFGWAPQRSSREILEDIAVWLRDNERECREIFA